MKKLLLALMVCVFALDGHAIVGETFEKDGITYEILNEAGTEAAIINASFSTSTVLSVLPSIYYDGKERSIVKLYGAFFKGNTKITRINGGTNLKTIGDEVFSNCQNLTYVDLSAAKGLNWGKSVFSGCAALEEAKINGVIDDADQLFANCTGLKSVTFGNNIGTKIPYKCFYNCNVLAAVNNMAGITAIGEYAFTYTYALEQFDCPDGLAQIDNYAFQRSGLTEVTVPANVVFGQGVFMSSKLRSITFEEGTTSIPQSICSGCTDLTVINMPKTVETIGKRAFKTATSLETVVIPSGVKEIDSEAFNECTNIKTVIAVPQTPPVMIDQSIQYGSYAFSHTTYEVATLYVSESSKAAYEDAFVWENFKKIVGKDPIITSVEAVNAPSSASVIYYDLNGVLVDNPERGVFIKVCGNNVEKIIR